MTKTFLEQWVKGNPVAQGPAKQHEFTVYIPPLLKRLDDLQVRNVVDFQADEGVISVAFCAQSPENHSTFVLPKAVDDPEGTFRRMAEDITAPMRETGQLNLVATSAEIKDASADAILFNNILGCQATLENIEEIAAEAGRIVKPGGWAIITAPNAQGGTFSSYSCSHLPAKDAHGASYDFQMRGEEAVFKNLYLSDKGLADTFQRHGFGVMVKARINDRPYEGVRGMKPAFFQYLMPRVS